MWEKCHQKWLDLNPTYSMIWFSNKERLTFVREHFDGRVLNAYKTLIPGSYKVDLWRLCILYIYGGVYVDAHTVPYASLNTILNKYDNRKERVFISVKDCDHSGGGINNSFIIAERHHPFLLQGIIDIVTNVENRFYGSSSLEVTGPLCLTKSLTTVSGNKVHKHGWNDCGDLSYYLFKLDFPSLYHPIYDVDGTKISEKEFSELWLFYRKNIKTTDYAILWKKRQIYLEQDF
jgi:mannosyltransferase OCH1-like enzyme